VDLKEALLAISSRVTFHSEQERLDVDAAIIEALTEPEPLDGDDAKLNSDPNGDPALAPTS